MLILFNEKAEPYAVQDLLRLFFSKYSRVFCDNQANGGVEHVGFAVQNEYEDLVWYIEVDDEDSAIFSIDLTDGNFSAQWRNDDVGVYSETVIDKIYLYFKEKTWQKQGGEIFPCRKIIRRRDSHQLLAEILPNGDLAKFFSIKRDNKRLLYFALKELTGKSFPWGCLTGIRPTLLVHEISALFNDENVTKSILRDYYGLDAFKTELALATATEEKFILQGLPDDSLGVYISIPFCPTRCLYCSFSTNEGINQPKKLIDAYLEALATEIKTAMGVLGDKTPPISVLYVGGGTPGVLDELQIEYLGKVIKENFLFTDDAELTFEAGRPDFLNIDVLKAIRKAGFNKICLNPQTFNDQTLLLVNRLHSVEKLLEVYEIAKNVGFDSINMDLILGLPGEEREAMKYSLKKLAELKPDSFTIHSLAIKRASNLKNIADECMDLRIINNRNQVLEDLQKEAYFLAKSLNLVPYYMYRQKDGVGALENLGYAGHGKGNRYNLAMMGDGLSIMAFGAGSMSKLVSGDLIKRSPNVKSIELYIQRCREMAERKITLWQG